ncbi:MAG: HD family phosphohydrolase [Pseudohongiella sp.]|nr:MAG: HD family phosphohydrolase [Pseudohongiella sp.]
MTPAAPTRGIQLGYDSELKDHGLWPMLAGQAINPNVILGLDSFKGSELALLILGKNLLDQAPMQSWRARFPKSMILTVQIEDPDADLILSSGLPLQQSLKLIEIACYRWLHEHGAGRGSQPGDNLDHLRKLAEIGISLSAEDDLLILLRRILEEGQNIACCDAASLFLIDEAEDGERNLLFKLTQNDSVDFPFEERKLPLDEGSIVGHVALNNSEVNIDDVYQLDASLPYKFNKSFDESTGYRTKSIFAIPLTDKKKSAIGVVQFINRKKSRELRIIDTASADTATLPFDSGINILLQALASQAGIAIENTILQNEIKNLFEGFVNASVAAIEQRDPTTSGHSFRVADLCVGLADSVSAVNGHGKLAEARFDSAAIQELRYAALLHDFGKVGVRESVLVKEKKLQPGSLQNIHYRIQINKERLINAALNKRLALMEAGMADASKLAGISAKLEEELSQLDRFYAAIAQVNEPSILNQANKETLEEISNYRLDGEEQSLSLVTDEEFQLLTIPKGSLSTEERKEIESHVVHTQNFLNLIPWTSEFKNIPAIAAAHHEKLDGSGYPYGMKDSEIPLPSKIMTICDIYDALTASDRPYKPAMPNDRALNILEDEARKGLLDDTLVEVFIDAKVFECLEETTTVSVGSSSSNHPCDPEFHQH